MTSAMVCITKRLFLATPPIAMALSIRVPCARKRSTMARDPKAVASTRPR
jgi:hypothetical protein